MGDMLTAGWKMLVVRGVIGIVFGILAIVWPLETAVALMWGAVFVLGGLALRRELTGPQTSSAAPSRPA